MHPVIAPIIALTPGEPAGIGPDITLQLAQKKFAAKLVCFADNNLLQQRAQQLNININIESITDISQCSMHTQNQLQVIHTPIQTPAIPGELNSKNAAYVLDCIKNAVQHIQNNKIDALVTGPVHKGIINEAGIPFTGHTEYLAELTHGSPVMMLAANNLRVALVTTHLPLRQVSDAITADKLEQVIRILHDDLVTKFSIKNPNILVCGLNPHAGEDGHLGHEEIEIIEPVLKKLRQENLKLQGPLPADTVFTPKYLDQADAVLAMYHDQGLPVLKHVGFGHAINITLGLPIIRTSVDHGTALDLAGTGKANTGSFNAAINLAIELSSRKTPTK
jgi:4-hydroxythreonine-4-phosphate dehydrogenase